MKKLLFTLLFLLYLLLAIPVSAKEVIYKVTSVVDGDTIKVNINGKAEIVRLLGIDTPEGVDPRKTVQCFSKEATNKMKTFVSGKYVKLVADKTQGDRDKYKRLLRYVYLTDKRNTFVNGEMVYQGYAFSYREYPTMFLDKFNAWEKFAREHNLGLWKACPLTTIAPTKVPTAVPARINVAPTEIPLIVNQAVNSGSFACDCSKTCTVISSCEEAQYLLNSCGCSQRDADKDGIACDGVPLHCQN